MREIKFRGLRTDGKGWVYGMLFHNNKIVTETVSYESPLVEKGSSCYKYDYINIIPESVGQFTGFHDKNGKEIYIGDIYKDEENELFVVIQMDCGRYALQMIENIYVDEFINWSEVEIIGNIHTTPKLLNN